MASAETRKQGNSLVTIISATSGAKEGEEFVILRKNNGPITLILKVEDLLKNTAEGESYPPELAIDYSSSREEVDGL